MSIFASILRSVYKLSGAKKAFALPEDALRKEIERQNRHRGVFTPTDHKAYYETITVNGFPCLIVRENPNPSKRAILYFFGGGMVIGPDKGDLPVMRKLCRETGCDVWFPFYPLCMEHCITETYEMVYADSGEFTYFFLAPDTSAETYHIEFRYGSDADCCATLRKRELLKTRHFRQLARKNKGNFGEKRESWTVLALLTRLQQRKCFMPTLNHLHPGFVPVCRMPLQSERSRAIMPL